jgi:ParB-like chromosome segregation protein Spo0J
MTGIELIAAERQRQIDVEGWSAEHDDEQVKGELSGAAAAYAEYATQQVAKKLVELPGGARWVPMLFPLNWFKEWWKPSPDPIRNLVKAGALIAAQIDLLQRKANTAK